METQRLWPDRDTGPWSVTLTWRLVDTRYECVGFAIREHVPGSERITAAFVRSVHVGGLIEEGRRRLALEAEHDLPEPKTGSGGRPRMYDREHYHNVANIYYRAWKVGYSPTKAVEKHYQVSHSTAARWVQKARESGVLGPAPDERKAGGLPRWIDRKQEENS